MLIRSFSVSFSLAYWILKMPCHVVRDPMLLVLNCVPPSSIAIHFSPVGLLLLGSNNNHPLLGCVSERWHKAPCKHLCPTECSSLTLSSAGLNPFTSSQKSSLFKLWIINIDAQVYNIQTDTNKIIVQIIFILIPNKFSIFYTILSKKKKKGNKNLNVCDFTDDFTDDFRNYNVTTYDYNI